MVQLTYYPPRREQPGPPARLRPREAMHGFTMDDLHQAAKIAVSTKQYLAADRHDLYQAAWDAIIDLLCETQEPPTRYDLVCAGQQGIQRLRDEFVHTYGYDRKTGEAGAAPSFAKFWGHSPVWNSPVEDAVIEKIATKQVVNALPANQRNALVARAAADSQRQAAALAGLEYNYLGVLVREARATFFALWFEGETPVAKAPKTYYQARVRQHQPCGTPAGYRRHRHHKEQACDECRAAIAAYVAARKAARHAAHAEAEPERADP